jgi:Domain of unknown function (DUF1931)
MVMGAKRLEEFLRRSSGVGLDKSDVERLTDLRSGKLNKLLVIGVRNASYNNRDVVIEPDLPLTKGFLECLDDFRRYDEAIELTPILEHLATSPMLERALSPEVEAMLPALVGTLALIAGQTMKTLDPDVKNPDANMWERELRLMELML